MSNIIKFWKKLVALYKETIKSNSYIIIYRIVEIAKNEHDEYTVMVQIINKSAVFYMKPEEILADDNMVNSFSPTDVRTLTYLGYLGINAPTYKILAHRMANNNQIKFALHKKGEKQAVVKTASEIMQDEDVITHMKPVDAHTVGYNLAVEEIQKEAKEKETAIKSLEKNK